MLVVYDIEPGKHELNIYGMCEYENVVVDRIEIESVHPLQLGWISIYCVDHLMFMGPGVWFTKGGLNFCISPYTNFRIRIVVFDLDKDKWFHGSKVRLKAWDMNGKWIKVEHRGKFGVYTEG